MAHTVTKPPLLECRDVEISVSERTLVRHLTFAIEPGSFTCVLGCNGAGKTTTLHTIAGLRAASHGAIRIAGRALHEWPRKSLARYVGLLTQATEDAFPSTVLESVLVGRHPHLGFWQWEDAQDRDLARAALQQVGLQDLEHRNVMTLSGGERRRVAVAALLTQDPDLVLLDEPINHLDPHHQIEVMQLFQQRSAAGRAVIATLHDAGLAARFADQALLLFGDGRWSFGPTAQVLNPQSVSELYGIAMRELTWDNSRTFVPEHS